MCNKEKTQWLVVSILLAALASLLADPLIGGQLLDALRQVVLALLAAQPVGL